MPRYFLFEQPPSKPLVVQHVPQMGGEQGQADRVEVELHTRTVIADGPDHRLDCSCGYLSCAYADRYLAEIAPCEVEDALAISQERRRRMLSSHASMGVGR